MLLNGAEGDKIIRRAPQKWCRYSPVFREARQIGAKNAIFMKEI